MNFLSSPRVLPILLLICSNVLMTFAWYGHLRYKTISLTTAILVSWGIAFFEYCLAVPANRIGSGTFSVTELKIIQEILTLSVFAVFAIFYLHERIHWNHLVAFFCILAAVFFTFIPKTD